MKTLTKLFIFFVLVQCVVSESVIIIGAGAAGIATATKLLENNFTDFLVLEAENRTGGRIFSTPFGDSVVDLGAEWCHGEKGNIVFELVKDLDLLKNYSDQYEELYHSELYKLDKKFSDELVTLFEDLYENATKIGKNESVGEYFTREYNKTVTQRYSNNSTLMKLASETQYMFLSMINSIEGSFSAFDVSLADTYKETEGDQALYWNGVGYKTILDILMKKYPNPENSLPIDDKIFLNEEVVEIFWEDNTTEDALSRVLVKCSSGHIFYADLVVVTVSVGVLKEKAASLFIPRLPSYKAEVIQSVGFDGVSKVFLWYPQRWWPDSEEFFSFVWSSEDRKKLVEEGRAWILDCFSALSMPKNPNVLSVWWAGENIPEVEAKSDNEVLSAISFIFEKFLSKDFNLTTPAKILRSKWVSHPHFRGTYSYHPVKYQNHDVPLREGLARPLLSSATGEPVLLFAGEATNLHHFSTVHGAIETGHREANRIIEFMQTRKTR